MTGSGRSPLEAAHLRPKPFDSQRRGGMETPPELSQVLGAFGLGPGCESRYLPDGLMNRNWRIDAAEGSFALKELKNVTAAAARRNLAVLGPSLGFQ